ncbi:unnamed protein product [Oncorhynchus mykiss]|uniref:Uncharacterized protein n=1 Tax=Oncorhynchus mykiss TaxID=8022 RepID=A0A060XG73_ONCMY|nr:unnamed protein product [Oncorhynchus mykiss]
MAMENIPMDTYSLHHTDPSCRTLRECQLWASPKVSERYLNAYYPTVGQISPRTRKSMSLDMGQASHANTKKLLGTRKSFDHLISDSKAPKRPETESGVTTPPKVRCVAENDNEIDNQRMGHSHLRKMSVTESNVLLDEEVLTDPKVQALLLTVLATQVKYTTDDFNQRILYEYLAEASVVFPKVFPVVHNLLDSKINTLLSMCQDTNLLNPVHGIVQSVIYHEESPPQYQPSYLQSMYIHLQTCSSHLSPLFLIYLISHHSSLLTPPFLSLSPVDRCLSLCPYLLFYFSHHSSVSLSRSLFLSPPLLFSSFISLSLSQSPSPPLHLISHPSPFSAPSSSLALSPDCYVVFSSLAV